MTRYKEVEEKIDTAMKLSKETGKEQSFNICIGDGNISTTEIAEDRNFIDENKCQGTKGSFHIHPGSKDVSPSPKDPPNIQPDVVKV